MHDIKAIREDAAGFDAALFRRGILPLSHELLEIDEERRRVITEVEALQAQRNVISKKIGEAKRFEASSKQAKADEAELERLQAFLDSAVGRGSSVADIVAADRRVAQLRGAQYLRLIPGQQAPDLAGLEVEGANLRKKMEFLEVERPRLEGLLQKTLATIPNILDVSVPAGKDEQYNKKEKEWGQKRDFGFTPKQHFELGEALGLMDFAGAAKLAGSRFTVLHGALARLERALGQFMLDVHTTEHGYCETVVPLLVNDAAVFGTAQLPKFAEDLFQTTDGRWLIPTAEVSLTNLAGGEILPAAKLPWRLTALTPCFRSEAGSAGRDVRGMLRQHQFSKVELVSVVAPEESEAEHERMTRCAETILERLELPYRRMLLCAGDTGFGAVKTYDLEVWVPGQGTYREISSCSNTRAFQARRMNARFRPGEGKPEFVHTLNGSGVALGRAMIAVLENYQEQNGSITVPDVLRPYMGGLEIITAG